jgi:hypothetical protein
MRSKNRPLVGLISLPDTRLDAAQFGDDAVLYTRCPVKCKPVAVWTGTSLAASSIKGERGFGRAGAVLEYLGMARARAV